MQQSVSQENDRPCQAVTGQGAVGNESKSEQKEVSPFCEFCKQIRNLGSFPNDPHIFTDKYGFAWQCLYPACPHAMKIDGVIMDCMILNRIYLKAPGSMQDLPNARHYPEKRRKFRAQLGEEFKAITGMAVI